MTDTAPTLTLDSPIDGAAVATSMVEVKGNAKDDLGAPTVEVSVNDGAWTAVPLSSEGSFAAQVMLPTADSMKATVAVRATDSKLRTVKLSRMLTVDNVAPTCAVTSPLSAAVIGTRGSVAIKLSASDGSMMLTNPRVSVDGATTFAAATAETGGFTFAWDPGAKKNASYSLVFRVDDASGHTCEAKATVKVDNVKPVCAITTPYDGAMITTRGNVAIGMSASDGALQLTNPRISTNGGTTFSPALPENGNFTFSWAVGAENGVTHGLVFRADDATGDSCEAKVTVTVDNVNPVCAITTPADGAVITTLGNVAIGMSASDGALMLTNPRISTNGGTTFVAATPDNGNFTFAWALGAENGLAHGLVFRADDATGDFCEAKVTVTVDNVKPTVGFTDAGSLLGPAFFAAGGLLTGPASDGTRMLKSVTVSFADAGVKPAMVTAGQWSIQVAAPVGDDFKPERATVVATDLADNTATASLSVTVDVVPPVLAITSPAANAKLNQSSFIGTNDVTLVWTLSDGDPQLSIGMVTADGGVISPSPVTTSATDNPKSYSSTLLARDRAGNSKSASVSFSVDRVAPTVTTFVPANNTRMYTGGVVVDFSETMTGGSGIILAPAADGGWSTAQRWSVPTLAKDTVYAASAGAATDTHGNPLAASSFNFHTETWTPASGATLTTGFTSVRSATTDPEGVIHIIAANASNGASWIRLNPSTGAAYIVDYGTLNPRLLVAWRTVQPDLSSRRLAGLTYTQVSGNLVSYTVGTSDRLNIVVGDAFIPTPAMPGEGAGLNEYGIIVGGQYERFGRAPVPVNLPSIDQIHVGASSASPPNFGARWEIVRFRSINAFDRVADAQTFGCFYNTSFVPAQYDCLMSPVSTSPTYSAGVTAPSAASLTCSAVQTGANTTFTPWQPWCQFLCTPFPAATAAGGGELVADRTNDGTFYSVGSSGLGVNSYQVRKSVHGRACVGAWTDVGAPLMLPTPPQLVVIRGNPGLIYADTDGGTVKFVTP